MARCIELKTAEIKQGDQMAPFDYSEVLKTVLGTPGGSGLSVDEIRTAIQIMDRLDKANGAVTLEDAEWSYLCQRLDDFKWAAAHREIVDLVDSVKNAKPPPDVGSA